MSPSPNLSPSTAHSKKKEGKRKAPDGQPNGKVLSSKDLDRWKAKAKDLEDQRDKLAQQLEELFDIRNTDAEQALNDLTTLYENRSKTQESLISALQAQLASQPSVFRLFEPESASTKSPPIPHFLTRAAADAEQHTLHNEVARMQDQLSSKDALVKEREQRIAELEQSVKDVRLELQAEIARSKELLARQQQYPNSQRTKVLHSEVESKYTPVVRFYEDFSNLLVLNVKREPRAGVEDDSVFTCMYTHVGTVREDEAQVWEQVEKTITFSLRVYIDQSQSEDHELDRRVKYTPLELDKLSDEFKDRLGFLASGFTFPHKQAALFLGTLTRQMESAYEKEKGDDESAVDEHENILDVDES